MSKLIPNLGNPYDNYTNQSSAWEEGFEAGKKSIRVLLPLSVTGRWWESGDKIPRFAPFEEYKSVQLAMHNNPKTCRWLTNEETREFT